MKERVQGLLGEIGFSGLEAAVYVALLHEPNATGYRISQIVGKPVANTYKALDSLKVKGAVVVDKTSGTRTYAALSINEYLDRMKENLNVKQEEMEKELKGLTITPMQSGIFQLTSVEQVYERVRNILKEAKNIVLVDAFPHPLEKIRTELNKAMKRGVKIFIKTYTPTEFPGCDLVAPEKETSQIKAWNGDWLNVFVDSGEFVQSYLKKEDAGVHEAVWSRNPYLSFLAYGGFVNELLLTRVIHMIRAKKDIESITQELRNLGKRYLEDTYLFDVLPGSWKNPWLKEQLKMKKQRSKEQCEKLKSFKKTGAKKKALRNINGGLNEKK
jgi:sugar-specific transcriptional regulator TrmB